MTTLTTTVTALAATVAALATQRLRAETNASGVYVWTFPVAYAGGVLPVVEVTVESGIAGAVWNHSITALSNTGMTVQLTRSVAVTVLGISVLGVAATPKAFVHLTARLP